MKLSKDFLDYLEERETKCNSMLPLLLSEYPIKKKTEFNRQLYLKIIIIINLIRGNKEQAVHYAKYYIQADDPSFSSHIEARNMPIKPDLYFRTDITKEDILYGICYFFLDSGHSLYRAHFEWASEYCFPRDEDVQWRLQREKEGEGGGLYIIARADSWYGYCLVTFGRFEEALPYLNEVVPYFKQSTRTDGHIEYWIEYHLSKALIPLCEYKITPSEENRAAAQKGLEEFIKKLNDFDHKRDAFLYYFHLKELFPDVYSTPAKAKKSKTTKKKEDLVFQHPLPQVEYPPEDESQGGVVIEVVADHHFEFVARKYVFERLSKKIHEFGTYPVLGNAYDSFVSEEVLEPESIVRECKELLNEPSLNEEEKESISEILTIATYAEEKPSPVQFLYNEYW